MRKIPPLRAIGLIAALVIVVLALTGCGPRVPNVVGMTGDKAVRTLQDAGYLLGNTNVMYTSGLTADTVTAQYPAAGERLRQGQAVALTVAKPLGSITVPNVTGKTEAEAKSIIASASLVATSIALYSETIETGIVGGQVPEAGSKLDFGATVALGVSKGKTPPKVKVPDVGGMKQADAEAALEKVDLVPKAYPTYSDTITKGVVGDQSPTAGKSVSPNSTVGFIVSQGKGTASVTVPSVTGKTSADAQSAIKSAGLVASVSSAPDPTVKKDVVISQMPPSGTKTAKGGTVGIVVSTGPESMVAVPNLMGLTAAAAKESIEAAGFDAYRMDDTNAAPADTVFDQLPKAGAKVAAGWPVIYAVSSGPPAE